MLDVHAPQGSVHGWKDFLFHMAAIACGLLLALALEKSAEYIHERHLLSDARRELAAELADNRRGWQKNAMEVLRVQAMLEADLRILRALRSHAVPEGKLDYSVTLYATLDGAWQAAHQNGSLGLMPHEEISKEAWFYRMLEGGVLDAATSLTSTMKIAGALAASAPPEKLDPQDLGELAHRTIEAQGRLDYLRMFLDIEEGGLNDLSRMSNGMGHP